MWDYIYLGGDEPAGSGIAQGALAAMRREFRYWYPFDLRVSGKDLIQVCAVVRGCWCVGVGGRRGRA